MEITEFVLARIAEDEAAARHYSVRHWRNVDDYTMANDPGVAGFVKTDAEHGWGVARTATVRDAEFIARHDPARVLRQCEAFRRIVEREVNSRTKMTYRRLMVLQDLAAIWSDHVDFDPEWATSAS